MRGLRRVANAHSVLPSTGFSPAAVTLLSWPGSPTLDDGHHQGLDWCGEVGVAGRFMRVVSKAGFLLAHRRYAHLLSVNAAKGDRASTSMSTRECPVMYRCIRRSVIGSARRQSFSGLAQAFSLWGGCGGQAMQSQAFDFCQAIRLHVMV